MLEFWSCDCRYMEDAQSYVFQYLFYRGLSIAIILIIYLFIKEGLIFIKIFFELVYQVFLVEYF